MDQLSDTLLYRADFAYKSLAGLEDVPVDIEAVKEAERQRAAEKAYQEELSRQREAKAEALANLWRSAICDLDIRHPDPKVIVRPWVEANTTRGPLVHIAMDNLTDTGNPDKKMTMGFEQRGVPIGWPGLEVARVYIVGLWTLYLVHEALELVTYKNRVLMKPYWVTVDDKTEKRYPPEPVINAHDDNGFHQDALLNTGNLTAVMDWAVGLGNGQKLIDQHASKARRELEIETRFCLGEIPREV